MSTRTKQRDEEQMMEAATVAGIDPNDILGLLDLEAPAWNPNEGEKVAGWIVSMKEAESEFGPYPLATILTEEGSLVTFHGFHKIARDALRSAQQGDRIGLKYKGRKPSRVPGRSEYADYAVIVQRRPAVEVPALEAASRPALGQQQ